MEQIARDIAKYAVSLDFFDLTPEVVHEVKRRLIDSLGCAFGAYDSTPGRVGRAIAKDIKSSKGATLIGRVDKTSSELATFANGMLIRYLDFNDTYLSKEPAHPSDNISAALAVAESIGSHAEPMFTAIVLGYEIHCRLCDAASLRSKGWDHVTYVSISSAVLAGKLIGLNEERMTHAISLAATPNLTLRQTRVGGLSMWKGCAAANAAKNGVFAALLAEKGLTGPSFIFEGEKGFFKQVTGCFELDTNSFGGKKGGFKILETYMKNFPTEYHSQAGVEAALELRNKVNLNDIESINIQTYDACIDIIAGDSDKWRPKTRETADHSLPYCIAVALIDGWVGLEQFSEEKLNNKVTLTLMEKIKVERDTKFTSQYPKAFPCKIDIKTKDGKLYSKTVVYPKGHPQNPLTDEEVEKKFIYLSKSFISKDRQKRILDVIWNIEDFDDISKFMKVLPTI